MVLILMMVIGVFVMPFSVLKTDVHADSTVRRTVKVGVLNHSMFAYQDDTGVWRGMDVECMTAIAQKAGFNIAFVDSGEDADFMENLNKGKYDILADIVQTDERRDNFLFNDETIGSIYNILSVRAEDDRWDYGNVNQVADMKIGILSSYANNKDFRDWCSTHGISPAIQEYENISSLIEALGSGEIDGAVHSTAFDETIRNQYRTVLKFLPEPYYFAFRKNDVDLKNKVDEALAQILSANIDYLTNLKHKYETEFEAGVLPFSASEKNYIAVHPVLKVAVIANDRPYSYQNKDGTFSGIIPDYYALIAEKMDVTFEYKEYAAHQDAVSAVINGDADIIGIFSGGQIAAYQSGIAMTDSISSVTNILLTKVGASTSDIKTIAVKSRSLDGIRRAVNLLYPDAELVEYTNADECFHALTDGKTEAALLGLPSATWAINQSNASNYNIIPVPDVISELCGGVKSNNQVLCTILNKCISGTNGNFTGISTRDTLPENNWRTNIARIPVMYSFLTASILGVLVLGLTWALITLRKRQKDRTAVLAAQNEMKVQKIQLESMKATAEERTNFFANISHDMRTPLNAVLGFIRLAKKDDTTPEQRSAYLEKAEVSSKLLLDLINDTLTVSKMSSGKMELHAGTCRMSELSQSIVTSIKSAAEKKNIQMIIDTESLSDCYIQADQLNLEKIFLNLLSNAVKYTPENGKVWYGIKEQQDEKKVSYIITVKDNGIGISKEFIDHIFEPFAQEKRPGYESIGTGLGLSIVKRLVDLMDGSIQVQSQINQGTEFIVHLSFAKADAEQIAAHEKKQPKEVDLSGMKVLLCEDNELNREIAVAVLSEKGISADNAENGAAAVEKFEKSPQGTYQAVLMDLRMPVMNGYEAAVKIRASAHPDAKKIPIIAMTADAFMDDVQKCMDAGMNGHLSKPIDPEKLFSVLSSMCSASNDVLKQ